jgi:hypothetical protein
VGLVFWNLERFAVVATARADGCRNFGGNERHLRKLAMQFVPGVGMVVETLDVYDFGQPLADAVVHGGGGRAGVVQLVD